MIDGPILLLESVNGCRTPNPSMTVMWAKLPLTARKIKKAGETQPSRRNIIKQRHTHLSYTI